jgi:hypothetical protein
MMKFGERHGWLVANLHVVTVCLCGCMLEGQQSMYSSACAILHMHVSSGMRRACTPALVHALVDSNPPIDAKCAHLACACNTTSFPATCGNFTWCHVNSLQNPNCAAALLIPSAGAFENTVQALYKYVVPKPREECTKTEQLTVSFAAGYIAGVFCAVVSHPADNLVSKLNAQKGATAGDIIKQMGWYALFTRGLGLRIIMIGTLTGLQVRSRRCAAGKFATIVLYHFLLSLCLGVLLWAGPHNDAVHCMLCMIIISTLTGLQVRWTGGCSSVVWVDLLKLVSSGRLGLNCLEEWDSCVVVLFCCGSRVLGF